MKKSIRTLLASILAITSSGCSFNPFVPFVAMDAKFPQAPIVTPFSDKYWLLMNDLTFEATRKSDQKTFSITVPAGFVTDLASIPVLLMPIYNNTGNYASAGILHDYLYWTQFCDRRKSDRLIKEGLKATYTSYLTRNTIKYGVYWLGEFAWNTNRKNKAAGEERYIPPSMRSFPAGTTWAQYRSTIPSTSNPPWSTPKAGDDVREGCDIFASNDD